MSAVVLLSWDPASSMLEYVQINDGSGGAAERVELDDSTTAEMSETLADVALPRAAELLIEGDDVLLVDLGPAAVSCAVRQVGSPGSRQFALTPKGASKPIAKIPVTQLGFADDELAGSAQALRYLYAAEMTPPGCWLGCEGGIGEWTARRRTVADQRRYRQQMADRFVNPYTFVPFPEHIDRHEPSGHHLLAEENLSGTFSVTWMFTSPFQVPEGQSGSTVLRLPGSSVKGAVRSLHETLAGGCLRVFDTDFIPSYRDPAVVRPGQWTMAVVEQHTQDGQALTARLCEDVCWVPADKLGAACGPGLATGSRVTLHGVPDEPNSLKRKELDPGGSVEDGGDWVVLVTSKGTRSEKKGTYFLACGRLGDKVAEVSEGAWRAFRLAVAGAEDLKKAELARAGRDRAVRRPTDPVTFAGQRIGRRRVVTGRLWQDDVIWARTCPQDDGAVVVQEIGLSAIWRHPGWPVDQDDPADRQRWTAAHRVPDDLQPCRDPGWLCPACRIFGSADPQARGSDDRAAQRGYGGHVRFGDACSPGTVELEQIWRAPLGAPRPGAGQFYLAYEDRSPAHRDRRPTREWGADPDLPDRRRLRGRKFYWHARPQEQHPPRHIARDHQRKAKLVTQRWIAPPGTILTQKISFDNLSRADLGGLLAVFDPGRVLPTGETPPHLHLGGGKPLGLGSCTASVSDLRVWDAASRYGGGQQPQLDEDNWVEAFREACRPEVTATWPALAAVLAARGPDAPYVWYPPGASWSARSYNEKTFDEPFAFFTASSGMFLADGKRELIPLPDPGQADQSLRIVPKDGPA